MPRIAAEPALEPDDRVEVEVVGRLVEQQQVRRAHQRAREVEPHAPAAGELGDAPLEVCRARSPGRRASPRRARAPSSRSGARSSSCACARRSPSPARSASASSRSARRSASSPSITNSIAGAVERGRLLRDVGDRPPRRQLDVARVRVQLARSSANRLDFPQPFGPINADALAGMNGEVRAVEQELGAAAEREFAQRDHGAGL